MAKLAATSTARNLIRVFFLQERLKAQGGKDHGMQRVHVVGAGVMGGDIAAWSAYKGFDVTLSDREQRFIDGALARAQALFAKKVKDETKRADRRGAPARRPGRRCASPRPTWSSRRSSNRPTPSARSTRRSSRV